MALEIPDPPPVVVEGEAEDDPHPASTAEETTAATTVHAVRTLHGRVVVNPIGAPPF
jgi:hypothetical protein